MLSVSVIFFTFALGAWVIGLYLVGFGAEPTEEGSNPLVTVGWVEVIVGVILASQVFILVQTGIPVLAGLVLLFAVFFIAFGVALVKGADLRPIGNLAIPVGILAALYLTFDGFNDTFLFQSSTILWGWFFSWSPVSLTGRLEPSCLGYALVVTALWGFLPAVYLALDQPIP